MIKNRYNRTCTSLVTVTLFCAGVMFSPVSFAAEKKRPSWLPAPFAEYHDGTTGESYRLTQEELKEVMKEKSAIEKRRGQFRDAQRKAKRGIVEKIEEQNIENKIHSVKFLPISSSSSSSSKVNIEVDLQYNGKRGLATFNYESAFYSDSTNKPNMFSDVALKPGRQKLTAFIKIYGKQKTKSSLTNIKLQLKDANDTVIIEKKLDEVIDYQSGKPVLVRTDDKDGLHTAVARAAVLIDGARRDHDLKRPKEILDKVIYEDPDNREAYIELARYHMKTKFDKVGLKSAEQMLKDGLSVDPNYANTRVLLGYVYTHQERYAEAEREFELAEKLGTDNLWLYTNWGQLYTKTDQKNKAYRMLDRVIKSRRSFTRNDRALTSGYRLYLSYLKKKYDVNKMGDVHAMRVANLKDEGCYQSEYAAHLVTYERELVESKLLAKSANKANCRRKDFINKVLAQVLLVRSLYAKYDGNDSADKDYRRSRALYNDQARIIADLSEKNDIGDLYQRLKQRRGLSVDTKGANGLTALAYCVNELRYTCVENLLSHGASPNEIGNKEGWSMLMLAVLQNNKPIIKRLLIAGADPNYATKEGITAHILAGYSADKDVAAMLKAASRI